MPPKPSIMKPTRPGTGGFLQSPTSGFAGTGGPMPRPRPQPRPSGIRPRQPGMRAYGKGGM